MREIDQRELTHERLAASFGSLMSAYDTRRRVETLVDDFLGTTLLRGRNALDVGCGVGHFSKRLTDLGAHVTACDIGPDLILQTKRWVGCEGVVADALRLTDCFAADSFDVIVSSECIEHTPQPQEAVSQMAKVLKNGGYLAISTPNLLWWPVVKLASVARLRPFDGFENFSSWGGLRRSLESEGIEIIEERGLHLFPFQFGLHNLSTWIDTHGQSLRFAMINICLLGQKR